MKYKTLPVLLAACCIAGLLHAKTYQMNGGIVTEDHSALTPDDSNVYYIVPPQPGVTTTGPTAPGQHLWRGRSGSVRINIPVTDSDGKTHYINLSGKKIYKGGAPFNIPMHDGASSDGKSRLYLTLNEGDPTILNLPHDTYTGSVKIIGYSWNDESVSFPIDVNIEFKVENAPEYDLPLNTWSKNFAKEPVSNGSSVYFYIPPQQGVTSSGPSNGTRSCWSGSPADTLVTAPVTDELGRSRTVDLIGNRYFWGRHLRLEDGVQGGYGIAKVRLDESTPNYEKLPAGKYSGTFKMLGHMWHNAYIPYRYPVNVKIEFEKTSQYSVYQHWCIDNGLTLGTNDAKDDDPDGDQRTNLEEFAFGTNPLQWDQPSSTYAIQNGQLAVMLPIRVGTTFETAADGKSLTATIDGFKYELSGSYLAPYAFLDTSNGKPAVKESTTIPFAAFGQAVGEVKPTVATDYELRTFTLGVGSDEVVNNPAAFIQARIENEDGSQRTYFDPVGYASLVLEGSATASVDSIISLPMQAHVANIPHASGTVKGLTDASFALDGDHWTAGVFTPSADNGFRPFYVRFESGQIYRIKSNTTAGATLALPASVKLGDFLTAGDTYEIFPGDTLLSAFGDTAATQVIALAGDPADAWSASGEPAALTTAQVAEALNNPAAGDVVRTSDTLLVYDKEARNWPAYQLTEDGWRQSGDPDADRGNTPIAPDAAILYQRATGAPAAVRITLPGRAPSSPLRVSIPANDDGGTLQVPVATYFPTVQTLEQSKMQELSWLKKQGDAGVGSDYDRFQMLNGGGNMDDLYVDSGGTWRSPDELPWLNQNETAIEPTGGFLLKRPQASASAEWLELPVPYAVSYAYQLDRSTFTDFADPAPEAAGAIPVMAGALDAAVTPPALQSMYGIWRYENQILSGEQHVGVDGLVAWDGSYPFDRSYWSFAEGADSIAFTIEVRKRPTWGRLNFTFYDANLNTLTASLSWEQFTDAAGPQTATATLKGDTETFDKDNIVYWSIWGNGIIIGERTNQAFEVKLLEIEGFDSQWESKIPTIE